jgi:hypothetical protein
MLLTVSVGDRLAPMSSAISQYSIQNADGDIVAISTMGRNFGREIDINDQQSGKRLLTISKEHGTQGSWSASFREGINETLASNPRVIVMTLAAASSAGSWGLGGPLSILFNPLLLLLLLCCCCACCASAARYREARDFMYDELPSDQYRGGVFGGQGYSTGYGSGQGSAYGGTQYV